MFLASHRNIATIVVTVTVAFVVVGGGIYGASKFAHVFGWMHKLLLSFDKMWLKLLKIYLPIASK